MPIKFDVTQEHIESYPNFCIVTGVFNDSYLFPSTIQIDKMSQGYISSLLKRNNFNGSINQHLLLYDAPYFFNKLILLIGCGKKNEFKSQSYNTVIHYIINFCKKSSITKILLLLSELNIDGYDNYWKIRNSITLCNNECYIFNKFKNINDVTKKNITYEIISYIDKLDNNFQYCKQAVKDGLAIAKGLNIAKNLGNMPSNYCTPNYLSNKVQELSNYNTDLDIEIINELQLKTIGMHAYLAVGSGSIYPAVMPIIKYQKNPKGPNTNPIILIGKGVTFDSGGISIKPSDKMDEMKYDMCGAAAVYAIMSIVSELQLPLNIIGILAVSENMISSKSLKPGDILTTLSGQTIEILNTDAEGRLLLCDVLTYVERYNPEIVIDIATLTGACVIALGNHYSGLMSNDNNLSNNLIFASKQTRDYIWRLPLDENFEKQLESSCADIANVGGRSGGAITAACFLKKFAHKYKWMHLDIAGSAWISKNCVKSSTGRPVELLTQFLINISKI
ncbi:cytosol aminopeptidase [Candidatus Blochmanniella floridana]|uniref:Probable cytosol aminopeptidase n=1 Tax=Blochmanniella floridana TaxID=203907 RepID=AMPA_BLOFL|nr:RecName: Full=Probable cytosol aminopeptidase; AltName: Full=Leucine aminopeptidase; Short=LAP; AltName: Full=Leucyl aminopeptidase [Candidatus Blochmannia floridanus]CAD83563.1 cytosol aminopeptidase [Candidatus Blochmannia floridanus]